MLEFAALFFGLTIAAVVFSIVAVVGLVLFAVVALPLYLLGKVVGFGLKAAYGVGAAPRIRLARRIRRVRPNRQLGTSSGRATGTFQTRGGEPSNPYRGLRGARCPSPPPTSA